MRRDACPAGLILVGQLLAGLLLGGLGLVASPVLAQNPQVSPGGVRVGLALSGGSAKGFAHVGVLRALERAGVRIDAVAGTSMGSVVGGLYAIGLSTDSIARIIAGADWPLVLGNATERERRFLHQRRFDERAIATLPIEGGIVSLAAGATVGSNVLRLAEQVTWPVATIRSFADFPRPFAAVATDIETGEAVVLTGGVLSEAMRASVGIPGAFEPFELDGRFLVDGAVARNLPASDARALDVDIVICSDVSDPLATREELGSMVDVLNQVLTLSMRQSTTRQRALCDILVLPEIDGLSGFDFDQYEEWFDRGEAAAELHFEEFRGVAERQVVSPRPAVELLGDSVRAVVIEVEGSSRPQTDRLVRAELGVVEGEYVSPDGLAYRLTDLDATGLFGIVGYRLDDVEGGVALTVRVEERPRDGLGVGLRYDDERRASLLFTATMHNLVRYGSVTRLDLRVGEETVARISYLRRHGVTGRLEGGTSLAWSQGELRLGGLARPTLGLEITSFSSMLGLVAGRTTLLGVEALGEWAGSNLDGVPDVLLFSAAGLLDHESLDEIDFPHTGVDATIRWESGVTDLVDGEGFTLLTGAGRAFIPLHDRWTLDVGAFVGLGHGRDLPTHRTFFVGGAHPSAIFRSTQPLFHGIPSEELVGTAAQVGRIGLRWRVRGSAHVRVGMDVGGALSEWRFPMEDPVVGWAVTAGVGTLLGPVFIEWGRASNRSGDRLTVSVGRWF